MNLEYEFSNSQTTPLDSLDLKNFKGLKFFAIDEAYKVKAKLTRFNNPIVFDLICSHDSKKPYKNFGKINFELKGKEFELTLLEAANKKPGFEKYLLVCFTDETSGKETFSNGRYIDFEIPKTDEIEIDFNLAYNPYCAFSGRYSCPIPPKENNLNIEVKAGEKFIY